MDQGEQPAQEGAPEWMSTYGDMVTLLLTFFIMLYALSLLEKKAQDQAQFENIYQQVMSAISQRFGASVAVVPEESGQNLIKLEAGSALIQQFQRELQQAAQNAPQGQQGQQGLADIRIEQVVGGAKLTLPGELLFDLGSAGLRPECLGILDTVAKTITSQKESYDVGLLGHTDDTPIRADSGKYIDNLELSCVRASNVARYFIDKHGMDPAHVFPSGMGEWHPVDPKVANTTAAARAANRRVEILVLAAGSLTGERQRSGEGADAVVQEMRATDSGASEAPPADAGAGGEPVGTAPAPGFEMVPEPPALGDAAAEEPPADAGAETAAREVDAARAPGDGQGGAPELGAADAAAGAPAAERANP
jgi:chemotaxis protein MotB